MRRNSGDDEGRNNLLDPTVKEQERDRGKSGAAAIGNQDEPDGPGHKQRTTEMGSHARKTGQSGHGSHR